MLDVTRMFRGFRQEKKELESMVALSMKTSEAIAAVSFVTGDVREVSDNTQSIAAALEEINATVNEISRSSNEVVSAAQETENAAGKGRQAVQNSVVRMDGIAGKMTTANESLDTLSNAVTDIGGVLEVIETLAKQTNLLALNAAVEAARAGDAGQGFAVVAGEVKALAGQTATATENIRKKIGAITDGMNDMATAMKETIDAVEAGRGEIHDAGTQIDDVVNTISSVTRLMSSTASSVTEQTAALDEITRSVEIISQKTTQSAGNADLAVEAVTEASRLIDKRLHELGQMKIPGAVMDLAMSDHIAWKKRLAAMLVGAEELEAKELTDHHQCRLGKWYDTAPEAVRAHPAYAELEAPHAAVHEAGRRAAALFAKGNRIGAQRAYAEMSESSVEVIEKLQSLKGRR